jgi:hypothetical protein
VTWRDKAKPIIARVLVENEGKTEAEIRAALRLAYPFGPREMFPYKIWCDEIRVQMGKKPIKTIQKCEQKQAESSPGQKEMFE